MTAYKPQLFVVIGGTPETISPEQYRRIMSGNSDVRLMTYDDLLKRTLRMTPISPFDRTSTFTSARA